MIAIRKAYRTGLLKPENWARNVIAGLIVGVVALPLAMAFAMAIGVKPEDGLYTAIVAGLIVGLFGGSQVQIAGPTGAFVVILANITAQYGIEGLQVATFLAGCILFLMGLVKLGSVIKFIPTPVIVGFTSGIGVIIFVNAWKDFLGLSVLIPLNTPFHQKLFMLVASFPTVNIPTAFLALISLFLIFITPKISKYIPGFLSALIGVTLLQTIFQFESVATIGNTFGEIPQHFPSFRIPDFRDINQILNLIGPAFTIALLGAIESLLSATAADTLVKTRHNSNQELLGQGLANIITPLFGGFAATGAIARTTTNIKSGGNSPLSSIVHAFALLFIILVLAPVASSVPLCVLASILCVVAYNMSDIPHFIGMVKQAPRYDTFVLLTTFFLTVFTDLVIAVNIGVILAMLFFVRKMHLSVEIEKQPMEKIKEEYPNAHIPFLGENIQIYAIHGPIFFGVTEKIERLLLSPGVYTNILIFRLKDISFIDMSGLETFKNLLQHYHQQNVKIYLTEANARVEKKLERMGLFPFLEKNFIFKSLEDVLKDIIGKDID